MPRDYYAVDPASEEEPCNICHKFVDDCTCPECEVCGTHGDPECINTHMPWNRWPAFFPPPDPSQEPEAEL